MSVEHDGPRLFPRTARKGEAFVLWPMIPGALHTVATRGVRWPLKNMLSEMHTTQLVAQGTSGNPGGRNSSPHPDTSEGSIRAIQESNQPIMRGSSSMINP